MKCYFLISIHIIIISSFSSFFSQDVIRFHQTNGYSFQIPSLIYNNGGGVLDSVWIDDMNVISYQQSPVSSTPGSLLYDAEGNQYTTIILGNGQQWMAENLDVSHFSNGDTINISNWNSTNIVDWYSIGLLDGENIDKFGKLYVNDVIYDTRNVCPTGWHVPTFNEWDLLIGYVDNNSNLGVTWGVESRYGGGILKDSSLNYWLTPNGLAVNSIGFCALPASSLGTKANFWAVIPGQGVNYVYGQTRSLFFNNGTIYKNTQNSGSYNSIRCLKN